MSLFNDFCDPDVDFSGVPPSFTDFTLPPAFNDDLVNIDNEPQTPGTIPSTPKGHRAPPLRLPNGRFMSKSQMELFEKGVSIDEILRLAAAEEWEKKQLQKEGVVVPKKKKTKRPSAEKNGPKFDSAALAKVISSVAGPSIERVKLNSVPSQSPNSNAVVPRQQERQQQQKRHPEMSASKPQNSDLPLQQRSIAVPQQQNSNIVLAPPSQQQATVTVPPACIQIINGQPVIQARLERIQAPDGTTMTVAVIPADIQGLLRASGFALPQSSQPIKVQPATNTTLQPTLSSVPASTTTSVDQRYAPIQPKTAKPKIATAPAKRPKGAKRITKAPQNRKVATPIKTIPKPAPRQVPPRLPTERFTFRLSAADERTVAELTSRLNQFQSMTNRTKADDDMMAELERIRTSILHRAATDQFKAISGNCGLPNGTVISAGASPSITPTMQMNGMQYAAMGASTSNYSIAPWMKSQDSCKSADSRRVIGGSQYTNISAAPTGIVPSEMQHLSQQPLVDDEQTMIRRRCERVQERLRFDQEMVTRPDCASRFENERDIVSRLMPYHVYDEPNVNEELLSAVDSDFRSFMGKCRTKSQRLYERFHKILDATSVFSESMDDLIVADLMMKEEKRSFDEEREMAVKSPDRYVEQLRSITNSQEIQPAPKAVSIDTQESIDGAISISDTSLEIGAIFNEDGLFANGDKEIDRSHLENRMIVTPISIVSPRLKSPALSPKLASDHVILEKDHSASKLSTADDAIDYRQNPISESDPDRLISGIESPKPECSDERIEARISVKVVIRKRRSTDIDDRNRKKSPTEIYLAESSAAIKGEQSNSGMLRVPPLKIRLRSKKDEKSINWKRNREGIRFLGLDPSDSDENDSDDESIDLKNCAPISCLGYRSPIELLSDENEDDDNSATTTSPGDSGQDEGVDGGIGQNHGDQSAIGQLQSDQSTVNQSQYDQLEISKHRHDQSLINKNQDDRLAISQHASDTPLEVESIGSFRICQESEIDNEIEICNSSVRRKIDQQSRIDRSGRSDYFVKIDQSLSGLATKQDAISDRSISRHFHIDHDSRMDQSISRNHIIDRDDQSIPPSSNGHQKDRGSGIPRLKLFRSPNFYSVTKNDRLNISSVISWKSMAVDTAAGKQSMDSADNEASEDDSNESL